MAKPTAPAMAELYDWRAVDQEFESEMEMGTDDALALQMQRRYEREEEQLILDEALAYSMMLDDSRILHDGFANGENDDEEEGEAEFIQVTLCESKPPPSCVCCVMALVDMSERRVMPCGHLYCVKCISTRCKMGVRDRTLVPAHCCKKEFPSEYVKETLTKKEWVIYERFVDEKNWVVTGLELTSDAEYAAVVQQNGWKQCPKCGVGVEKISGCEAVQCMRGHHFCYRCASAPCKCGLTNLRLYGYLG